MNRKEYEERIAKLEKELNELKEVKIVDDEFPKYGQAYWFVETDGCVVGTQWCGSGVDSYRKTFLRIFRTDEEWGGSIVTHSNDVFQMPRDIIIDDEV